MIINRSVKRNSPAIVYAMAFLFALLTPLVASADTKQKEPRFQIYFSTADQFGAPLREAKTFFDCSDKIYTVLELTNYPVGRHQLSVIWRDPETNTREQTTYPFNFRGTTLRLWAWLSLTRATGAAMLQWVDPAAGLEEFIGEWNVEVRINDKLLTRDKFQVNC